MTIAYIYVVNGLYKLINSISNRVFISNNVIRFNNNGVRLIKTQISEVSRVIKINNIAKSRNITKSRDIR